MKIDDFFLDNCYDFPTLNWEVVEAIPEIQALKDCPQHSQWHQEGDVFTHTKNSIKALHDFAAKHADVLISRELVLATLLHDIGKPKTTRKDPNSGEWVAPRHGIQGAIIARHLLCDENDVERRERVCALIRDHMLYHHCIDDNGDVIPLQIYRTNQSYAKPRDFLLLNYADDFGSTNSQTESFRYNRLGKIEDYIKYNNLNNPICFKTSVAKILAMGNMKVDEECTNAGFTMTLFVGLPGSGKDTYFMKSYVSRGYKMVSRDKVRQEMGIIKDDGKKAVGNKEQEAEVTKIVTEQIKECCRNCQSFVVNNTNLRTDVRHKLIEDVMLDPTLPKPFIEIVVFETPFKVCLERRKDEIKAEIMDKMYRNFEFPMPYEANRIFVYQDDELSLLWDDQFRCRNGFYVYYDRLDKLFKKHNWWKRLVDWMGIKNKKK